MKFILIVYIIYQVLDLIEYEFNIYQLYANFRLEKQDKFIGYEEKWHGMLVCLLIINDIFIT